MRLRGLVMVGVLVAACSDDGVVPQGGGSGAGTSGPDSSATSSTGATAEVGGEATGGEADTIDLGGADEPPCTCAAAVDELDGCDFESLSDLLPGCELDEPCPVVTVRCPRPGADLYYCGAELEYDEEALQCALEVLQSGEPARLLIEGEEDWGIYTGQRIFALTATGAGVVVRASCMSTDVGVEFDQSTTMAAPAEHFAGCLELETAHDRHECLLEGLSAGVDVAACG